MKSGGGENIQVREGVAQGTRRLESPKTQITKTKKTKTKSGARPNRLQQDNKRRSMERM